MRAAAASLAVLLTAAWPGPAPGADDAIAGLRPAYSDRTLSVPPNAEAIRARMWVPEIDLGYVPQGLTVAGDAVLLTAYNSQGGPPKCRLYRIDRNRLEVTGRYDLPLSCTHAGGLAHAGGNRLFVADTGRLYEIDLGKAFGASTGEAVVRALGLRFPLRGSFLAWRDGALWLGEYKKPQAGEIHELPLATVEAATDPPGLSLEHVRRSLGIAPMSQGAAFAPDGTLWLSQSNSQRGALQQVDPETGAVLRTFEAVAGIEDLGFDAEGRLWSVGEAGSKRWHNWPTFYPVLFSLEIEALR